MQSIQKSYEQQSPLSQFQQCYPQCYPQQQMFYFFSNCIKFYSPEINTLILSSILYTNAILPLYPVYCFSA